MKYLRYSFGLIIKVLLISIITVVILELGLTIFNDVVFQKSFFVYDPDIGFKVRPYARWGEHQTNEFGFNDRDYPHQKPSDTFRIIIIGDSFNWVGGPENNYTGILEHKFENEFSGQQVEIINIGYSETHTGDQVKILQKFGLQYNPDLVVLGFFVGNDFIDGIPWRRRIAIGTVVSDIDTRKGLETTFLGQPLVLQSRFYLFIHETWTTRQYRRKQGANEAQNVTMPIDAYHAMEYARMQVANQAQAAALATNEKYILDNVLVMQDLLAQRDIDFVVVAYPDEFQVDTALRQVIIDKYQVDTSTYQWDRPQRILMQFCVDHNIEYYDMLPVFQETHGLRQPLYLPNDSHWNATGNELAAQFLFDVLVNKIREI